MQAEYSLPGTCFRLKKMKDQFRSAGEIDHFILKFTKSTKLSYPSSDNALLYVKHICDNRECICWTAFLSKFVEKYDLKWVLIRVIEEQVDMRIRYVGEGTSICHVSQYCACFGGSPSAFVFFSKKFEILRVFGSGWNVMEFAVSENIWYLSRDGLNVKGRRHRSEKKLQLNSTTCGARPITSIM